MQEKCNEATLKKLTEAFWAECKVAERHGRSSAEVDRAWEKWYLCGPLEHEGKTYKPLLAMEIECAKQDGRLSINEPPEPLTLVILVGLTFEPLLQSIAVHKPQMLIPILNHVYGEDPDDEDKHWTWKTHWESLAEYVDLLAPELEIDEPTAGVGDSAEEVFTFLTNCDTLRQALTNPDMRVVIDITGAKKTMVAGAFLLGMQSKAEIWYIDTGKYKRTRPYGYSCIFRRVDQPIHDLKMEAWQRVRQAYEQYDFLWAKMLIPDDYIGELSTLFEMLHHWENGHLREASTYFHQISNPQIVDLAPSSIIELAKFWPKTHSTHAQLDKRFFINTAHILLYAKEEMERIERLMGFGERADYRAAYMRAYALHETLLKARIISVENPQTEYEWREVLYKKDGTYAKNRLTGRSLKVQVGGRMFAFPDNYELLRETRNRVAHTYYPLDEYLVEDVVALVEENLINYEEKWANKIGAKRIDKPEWDDVKTAFNLTIINITENR